jgi:hypothetical protein
MVRNGHGDGGLVAAFLHHHMTAAPPHLFEAVVGKNAADVGS